VSRLGLGPLSSEVTHWKRASSGVARRSLLRCCSVGGIFDAESVGYTLQIPAVIGGQFVFGWPFEWRNRAFMRSLGAKFGSGLILSRFLQCSVGKSLVIPPLLWWAEIERALKSMQSLGETLFGLNRCILQVLQCQTSECRQITLITIEQSSRAGNALWG
jgi:hypothetical protein